MDVRLWTCVALAAVLVLSFVAGDEKEIVEGETTLLDDFGDYERRQMSLSAWACTALQPTSPHLAYDKIEAYIQGNNGNSVDMTSDAVLFPLQEIYSSEENQPGNLCIYLKKECHCYPPEPAPGSEVDIKQKMNDPAIYYSIRYWGQSSTTRTQQILAKLKQALLTAEKEYDTTYSILGFFPNHLREVRVDVSEDEGADSSDDIVVIENVKKCPPLTQIVRSKKTWQQAQDKCISLGYDGLFTMDDADDSLATIAGIRKRLVGSAYWVGGQYVDGQWQWMDSNRPIDEDKEFNKARGCPHSFSTRSCPYIQKNSNPPICDMACKRPRFFLCSKKVTDC